jgi:hypothetical protein
MTRVGQPVDIARVVCFLASQDGEWVNGKVIGIDGAVSPHQHLFCYPTEANILDQACM